MGTLDGKTGLIFGVANHKQHRLGDCAKLAAEGARLRLHLSGTDGAKCGKLTAANMPDAPVLPCDVQNDEELDAVFGGEVGANLRVGWIS